MIPSGEAAKRAQAATAIQRSARGSLARSGGRRRAAATERESKYKEAGAKGGSKQVC